jgi:GNAT superfamily N-acetyltransferase
MPYFFVESKEILPEELSALYLAVGWGEHVAAQLQCSVEAYPFVAHARTESGALVGYVSAFSDGVFSTLLGELIVHPAHQRQGIATELLARVEAKFPNAPVYIKALGEAKYFFTACGYKAPKAELTVLFKKANLKPPKNPAYAFP